MQNGAGGEERALLLCAWGVQLFPRGRGGACGVHVMGSDQTYGKGLVQNVEELLFDTTLKFTVAK